MERKALGEGAGTGGMSSGGRKGRLVHLLVVLLLLLVALVSRLVPTEDLRLVRNQAFGLNEGWSLGYGNTVLTDRTLPADLALEPGVVYKAWRVLEEDFPEQMQLRIRSSMQSIQVLVDGEEIFSDEKPVGGLLTSPDASVWHLVSLPPDVQGKTLALVMESPVRAFSGVVNPVFYGRGDALVYDLLEGQRLGLLVSLVIFFLGLLLVLVSFFLRNMGDNRLLHLGLFAMAVSVWLLSEAKLLQLFTGNRFLLGGTSYMLVAVLPMPLLLYLREVVFNRYRRLMEGMAAVFFLDFLVNLGLQLSGKTGFFESLQLTNGMILASLVVVVFLLLVEHLRFGNPQAKRLLWHMGIFVALIVFEILQFFSRNFEATSLYSRLGIMVFLGLLAGDSVRYFNGLLLREREARFFEKLAFKDILTEGMNRAAFERDVEALAGGETPRRFRLVLLDMNHLKHINDRYGHGEGDRAITRCFRCMEETFGKEGACYRLGGDEFACILGSTDQTVYAHQLARFLEKVEREQRELPYRLEVAVGSDVYLEGEDFGKFFHRIDHMMYADKRRLKEQE
ncbi:sensor domain-containing diguanylate cyclase [Anaerotalea alkaliphila]|uniref:GGDEF domain-containing protein n=1 Tax=Anaerotalea alkaliphila TaxID=2662126 RepID=A0A7X5HVS7_9FIRM|nr:GGDEF domain-containing protein [Anaerotalea alkaliphila]NDL67572.1 GGDEF domain-containing protein [Anaerotalea alkaliphila]